MHGIPGPAKTRQSVTQHARCSARLCSAWPDQNDLINGLADPRALDSRVQYSRRRVHRRRVARRTATQLPTGVRTAET